LSDADRNGGVPEKSPSAISPVSAAAGLRAVDELLKSGALVHRWDAAEEILRILAERETGYPRLIEAKKLDAAEARRRNVRLACAWSYVVEPGVVLAGPHHYRDELQRALWISEARGWKPPPPAKGPGK